MASQPEDDLQRRLRQLESEINSQSPPPTENSALDWLDWGAKFQKLRLWFNGLSGTNKLIVSGVTVVLGVAIAQMVLKLVVSVVSLALLAGLVYLGYKKFGSGNSENKP